MTRPRALVLRAPGTNCDEETAAAWERAGSVAETWHVSRLLEAPRSLGVSQIVTIPGGFSYGDDLGAGRIFAARLGLRLRDALIEFHERGGLLLGICNGFQVLVRAGLLPGNAGVSAALTFNESDRFESRWVRLAPTPGRSPFLTDSDPIELPVAHGEGKFVLSRPSALDELERNGQIVLRYVDAAGLPAQTHPANPNGSLGAVAGICDATGRIFGLMPHPERHIDGLQHPRWTRQGVAPEGDGLRLFRNAVAAVNG